MIAAMRRSAFLLALATCAVAHGACGDGGDGVVEGARAECAFGGELTDCPDAERTPEGACWRLVDCGAIVLSADDDNRFDWGKCVDRLQTLTEDFRDLAINCVSAETCDELRADIENVGPGHCRQLFGPR